jgi:hypothetical protein
MSIARAESPKPTNTYTLNPLKCFLSVLANPTENNPSHQPHPFFSPDSLAVATIQRLNDYIAKLKSSKDLTRRADYTTLLYSPLFLCYTALPFYAALLIELKLFAQTLDAASKLDRQLVWLQYSALLGRREIQISDKLFMPVIASLISQETINLLDIEALYLAVLLTVRIRPSVLSPRRVKLVLRCSKDKQSLQIPENTNNEPLHSGITMSSTQQKIHPIKDPNIWEKLWQNASEFFAYLRRSNSDDNEFPLWLFNTTSTVATPSSPTSPEVDIHSSVPLKQNEIDYFSTLQQLMLLQHWGTLLDSLPQEKKEAIWRACQSIPSLSKKRNNVAESNAAINSNSHDNEAAPLDILKVDRENKQLPLSPLYSTVDIPFSSLIYFWAQNPVPHMASISGLYNAITMLYDLGVLTDDFYSPRYVAQRLQAMMRLSPLPLPVVSPPPVPPRIPTPISSLVTCVPPFGVPFRDLSNIRVVSPTPLNAAKNVSVSTFATNDNSMQNSLEARPKSIPFFENESSSTQHLPQSDLSVGLSLSSQRPSAFKITRKQSDPISVSSHLKSDASDRIVHNPLTKSSGERETSTLTAMMPSEREREKEAKEKQTNKLTIASLLS